ncbi:MAG: anthranilate synthase component I family protein [Cyanobacteria bacterium HKST-UBA04]|nr:anthranilate synthase component I family protein [Cyanobacteria bacterium HKST-UBA04]MCA9840903.1 anthranilate synthase component I family protein [Cyanobacteria bacterium HKST-UBA03]
MHQLRIIQQPADMTPARFRQWFYQLHATCPDAVLLDSCGWPAPTGGYYWMGFTPVERIVLINNILFVNNRPVLTVAHPPQLWQRLETLFNECQAHAQTSHSPLLNHPALAACPFISGWVGTLGYELNHFIEPTVAPRPNTGPFGHLYLQQMRHQVGWHPASQTLFVASDDPAWLDHAQHLLATMPCQADPSTQFDFSVLADTAVKQSLLEPQYHQLVQTCLDHIQRGNLYQANLSIRFYLPGVPLAADLALYEALVNRNPSPFSGLMTTPLGHLISNSPERLVRYDAATNTLDTRPIAGTRGRGHSADEQQAIESELTSDHKEQAEHLMLVDLERNDLGRVAAPASVRVPDAFVLEQYSHVTHLVSQIEAKRAANKTAFDLIQAMFPGGTITGCPKVRCMQLLRELEPVPRGLYTGSLGYLDFRGHVDFNILIRSCFHWPDERLFFHAGAGIVADSVPKHEYRECLRKTEAIRSVLQPKHFATTSPPQ